MAYKKPMKSGVLHDRRGGQSHGVKRVYGSFDPSTGKRAYIEFSVDKRDPFYLIESSLVPICVPVSSISLWPDNPRMNDHTISALSESIKENGFRKPIVVWKENRTIYAGNTAYKAAMSLGMEMIPCLLQSFRSEEEAIAFALSDNKMSELSAWDDGKLSTIFKSPKFTRYQGRTGFTSKEVGKILDDNSPIEITDMNGKKKTTRNVFTIKIFRVPGDRKDEILEIINGALDGTGFAADAY